MDPLEAEIRGTFKKLCGIADRFRCVQVSELTRRLEELKLLEPASSAFDTNKALQILNRHCKP